MISDLLGFLWVQWGRYCGSAFSESDGSMHGAWAWISAECGTEKMAYRVTSIGETSKKEWSESSKSNRRRCRDCVEESKKKHRAKLKLRFSYILIIDYTP